MNETLERESNRNYARIVVIAGFSIVLLWQALILFAAPRFVKLWIALEKTPNQQLPWISSFLIGNEFIRWAIFVICIGIAIYFARQKRTQFLAAMLTFSLVLALTIVMYVSLYAPLWSLTH